jgi:hypothetical protein
MGDNYLSRLTEECNNLQDKVIKLSNFIDDDNDIYYGLSEEKQFLLCTQLDVMQAYLKILKERIKLELGFDKYD